jgi:hypothetical protein
MDEKFRQEIEILDKIRHVRNENSINPIKSTVKCIKNRLQMEEKGISWITEKN